MNVINGISRFATAILYDVNVKISEGVAADKIATSLRAEKQARQAVRTTKPSGDTLTQTEPTVKQNRSDRDPDAVKVNQLLQKQNAELRDTVDYLKELVRLQGKVTDGTVYTRGSVEAAARRLMKGADAKGDVAQLQKILERTYKAMGEGLTA